MYSRLVWSVGVCLMLCATLSSAGLPIVQSAPTLATGSTHPPVPSRFGAGHILEFMPLSQHTTLGATAQDVGVKWTVMDVPWYMIELNPKNNPGVYTWFQTDASVASLNTYDVNIIGMLAYTPEHYSSNPTAPNYYAYVPQGATALNAWAAWLTATVNRYKSTVKHWMVWATTDDPSFFQPGLPEYVAALERAYTAIKAADPTAVVLIAPSHATFVSDLIDQTGTNDFDGIAIDNYPPPAGGSGQPGPYLPELSWTRTLRLQSLLDVLRRRAPGKSAFVTEYGWPTSTNSEGVTEATQAAYLNRSMLLLDREPSLKSIIWTNFYNIPSGGVYNATLSADNYGMVLREPAGYAHKTAYNAFKAMTTALNGLSFWRDQSPVASTAILEGFEGNVTYSALGINGASGSYTRSQEAAKEGGYSAKLTYHLGAAPDTALVVAPPGGFTTLSGTPTRLKLWARSDGSTAPMLNVVVEDATGETFELFIGLVGHTEWRELVYYLDADQLKSALFFSYGGNNNKTFDFPLKYRGFVIRQWSPTLAPLATTGAVYIDQVRAETGPSIMDQVYRGPGGVVHALWALSGSHSVTLPTTTATASQRTYQNVVTPLTPAGGQVTVTVTEQPLFVSFPRLPTSPTNTGVFRPSTGLLYLKNENTSGVADITLNYGLPGDRGVSGDWDGDGIASIGIYRSGAFFMRNLNSDGYSDYVAPFGIMGDIPIVGDWNGDGIDTPGIFRNGVFYLRNSNTGGPADLIVAFGAPGDQPIAGDWTNKGYDSVGIMRGANFFLRNSNTNGPADMVFIFGQAGDKPVAGDWNGDGIDSIGIFRNGLYALRNTNDGGGADYSFVLGVAGDDPITGDWDGKP